MNNVRTNLIGVDKPIQRLQICLYDYLNNYGAINGFGRVYENVKEDVFSLEHHTESGDYQNVLRNDDSRFFFYRHEGIDNPVKSKVDIVFMVNLDHFYDTDERNDEEIKARAYKIIDQSTFDLKEIGGIKYLNQLLKSSVLNTNNVKWDDMHPMHVFVFQTEITHDLNICD